MNRLSTYGVGTAKKSEGKKRNSPCTPYREKGKGKEIGPGACGTGPSCAGARVSRAGARTCRAGVRRLIAAVVADAMAAFSGDQRDERIWASIAWRVGADRFLDAIHQAAAEIREHSRRVAASAMPRIFQSVLNARFPRGTAR